jgi:CheY-like chemotaxis protein
MADILLVVDDLFFLTKIQQTAKLIGVQTEAVPASKLLESAARSPSGRLIGGVVVDLNHRSGSAVDLIRSVKSDPATANMTIVGFVSHVQTELAQAARSAGCDTVLARSAFTQQLPHLLRSLARAGTPGSVAGQKDN